MICVCGGPVVGMRFWFCFSDERWGRGLLTFHVVGLAMTGASGCHSRHKAHEVLAFVWGECHCMVLLIDVVLFSVGKAGWW